MANRTYSEIGCAAQTFKVEDPRKTVEPSPSLMVQAVREAFEALGALGASVDWLLQAIEPVCQEQRVGNADGDTKARDVQEMPSSLRGDLIKLRVEAERISARISSVRYTIEI